jgi:hypothetical protein
VAITNLPSVLFVCSGRGFAPNESVPAEYKKLLQLLQASSLHSRNSKLDPKEQPRSAVRLQLKPLSNHESVKLASLVLTIEKYEDLEEDYDVREFSINLIFQETELTEIYNHAEKQLLQKSARSSIVEKVVELGQGNPFYMEKLVQCIITKRRELRHMQRRQLPRRYTVGSIGDRPPSRSKFHYQLANLTILVWRRNKVADISIELPTTPTQSPRAPLKTSGPHLPMMSYFIPHSILDLVASQFDLLSTEKRLILKVASVMGTFDHRTLGDY